MENEIRPRSGAWKIALSVLGVCALLGSAGVGYYLYLHRDELPALPFPDLDERTHAAGHVERIAGQALVRVAVAADYPGRERDPSAAFAGIAQGLQENSKFLLGSLFQLKAGASVQTVTVGNWVIGLDGEGEFIFEDARTNERRTEHTLYWYVKKGTFRVKPHDYDPGNHMIQITTEAARVFVRKGEIGMQISEGGRGTVWLMSGKGVIIWNNGKRKELGLKGMDYI